MPKKQFPNIYRSFTEWLKRFNKKNSKLVKRFKFQSFLTLYILTVVLILLLSLELFVSFQRQKNINHEREKILSEIRLLEDISQKYPGNKDSYYQLALLEYQLRNFDKAKFYINKALYLDPNFKEAIALQKILRGY